MTDSYQVFARRFRPQTFSSVIGQDAIVTTMKNALKSDRMAHAYLFSGARGTGKTTLARLFAKAMNCSSRSNDDEPCNTCASCREISEGRSLDVIEIDGASHRGIDDIRAVSEAVSYAPTSGRFKVYLIDEVHMLTKEAFNALLKTLEEPPPQVKFFFATTEPHKVPATIVSRCQRFVLKRLSPLAIGKKLSLIAEKTGIDVDEKAIARIANYADGGLRDAESMFDQVVAFSGSRIDESVVQEVLGLSPQEWFYDLDTAIGTVDYNTAFVLSDRLFLEGKDIGYFLHDLSVHYKTQLQSTAKSKNGVESPFKLSQEELVHILELIAKAHIAMKSSPSSRLVLEWLFLSIIQIRLKIPLTSVVRKLLDFETMLSSDISHIDSRSTEASHEHDQANRIQNKSTLPSHTPTPPTNTAVPSSQKQPATPPPLPPPTPLAQESLPRPKGEKETPTADQSTAQLNQELPSLPSCHVERDHPIPSENEGQEKGRQESVMQFAAVELEGTVIKKGSRQ